MNTYLISSDSLNKINNKIKEISKGISNTITYNMLDNSIDEVLQEASYLSMFLEDKIIIVKNVKFFSNKNTEVDKENLKKVEKYLEQENPHSIIIFICDSIDCRKKIVNLLKTNGNVFIFNKLTRTEVKDYLKEDVLLNKFKISDSLLWYIVNCCSGNLDLAINELKKIYIYYGSPCNIEENVCKKLVSNFSEGVSFKLVDAIIKREYENSLELLSLSETYKVEASMILVLLYKEFKNMYTLLKKKPLKLESWQIKKTSEKLRLYTEEEIKEEIIKLADLDYKLKSGKIRRDVILLKYITELCL